MNNYNSAMILERIQWLCNIRYGKGKVKETIINCGLSYSIIDNLRKGSMPSVDKLATIADGLYCSTDYLLGRATMPSLPDDMFSDMEMDADEQNLITHFRELSDLDKGRLLERAVMLKEEADRQEQAFRQEEA